MDEVSALWMLKLIQFWNKLNCENERDISFSVDQCMFVKLRQQQTCQLVILCINTPEIERITLCRWTNEESVDVNILSPFLWIELLKKLAQACFQLYYNSFIISQIYWYLKNIYSLLKTNEYQKAFWIVLQSALINLITKNLAANSLTVM